MRKRISQARRYLISIAVFVFVWSVANYWHFKRPVLCADCVTDYGLPIPFLVEGGFVTLRRWVWGALIADIFLVFGAALVIGWAWSRLGKWLKRRCRKYSRWYSAK